MQWTPTSVCLLVHVDCWLSCSIEGLFKLELLSGGVIKEVEMQRGKWLPVNNLASCVGLIMVMILLLPCFSFTPPAGTEPQPAEFAIVRLGGPPAFSSPALLAADYTLASRSSAWLCSFLLLRDYHTHIHAQLTHTHTQNARYFGTITQRHALSSTQTCVDGHTSIWTNRNVLTGMFGINCRLGLQRDL